MNTEHATSVERVGQDVRGYCLCGWKGPRHAGFDAQFSNVSRRAVELAGQDGDAHEQAAR